MLKVLFYVVSIPLDFQTVGISEEYVAFIGCYDCGYFSKTGAGCKYTLNIINHLNSNHNSSKSTVSFSRNFNFLLAKV